MRYAVRAVEPTSEGDVLLRLWADNLPARGALDDKLRWFYREGPHGRGGAFVVEHAAKPVGCAGFGVRTFRHGAAQRRVALFADLAVDRDHRTATAALALVRAVREEVAHAFDFGYGFPNAKAVAVYRRAGYDVLGEMPRYVRVLRTAPHLRAHVGDPLATIAGALLDRTAAALARLVAAPARRLHEVRWNSVIDERFDELCQAAARERRLACERSSAFLRWRFQRQPGARHAVTTLHERRTGALRAYAVLRNDGDGTLHVADLFGSERSAVFALLAIVVDAATAARASAVGFRFLGDPRICSLLAALGFVRRRETRAIVIAPGRVPLEELRDVSRWYLTDLDEDT